MWFLYILWSEKLKKSYVGITQDILRRLDHHNSRKAGWTKRGQPWILCYSEEHPNKSEAQKKEYHLKTLAGWKEKQGLIEKGRTLTAG